jgi:hypothetical protein
MLRTTRRLPVRMPEVPELPPTDQPADTVLREPARRPARAPHQPRRNPQPPRRPPPLLIPVLHGPHRVPSTLTTQRPAEPLMPRHRQKIAPTQVAEATLRCHETLPRRPRTTARLRAVTPIPMRPAERPAATRTLPVISRIKHQTCRSASGREKIERGSWRLPVLKKPLCSRLTTRPV